MRESGACIIACWAVIQARSVCYIERATLTAERVADVHLPREGSNHAVKTRDGVLAQAPHGGQGPMMPPCVLTAVMVLRRACSGARGRTAHGQSKRTCSMRFEHVYKGPVHAPVYVTVSRSKFSRNVFRTPRTSS
jgi:hypothetical protein